MALKQNERQNLSLKIILVEDEKVGGFTAFFSVFPNVIAEGQTEDEAQQNNAYTERKFT